MTKFETFSKRLQDNKEILKSAKNAYYFKDESELYKMLFDDCQRYIKAIKEYRMGCIIVSVSKSGMSRNIKFFEGRKNGFSTFFNLFQSFGYSNKDDSFRVNGCGMDMIFHTNYSLIHNMCRLGLLSKKQCSKLAQQTPTVL